MPDFLKDSKDVIFVTAAEAFKEAIDAYKRGEFREARGSMPAIERAQPVRPVSRTSPRASRTHR